MFCEVCILNNLQNILSKLFSKNLEKRVHINDLPTVFVEKTSFTWKLAMNLLVYYKQISEPIPSKKGLPLRISKQREKFEDNFNGNLAAPSKT